MAKPATEPLVILDDVSAGYQDVLVLHEVNLSVRQTDFTGVVGPSGAGKTTLLRLLLGTLDPVAGARRTRPDLRIAYVPQLETVDWNFPVTVMECVLMARTEHRVWPWSSRSERREALAVLERLGIADLAERHIRELSGGQQQRMFLARALLREPHLLLLDEPTSGVDVNTRHDVLHLLGDLHSDGMGIVLTTHDLNGMAAHLPHLVCVNGHIVAEGSPRNVIVPGVLEETFGARLEVLEHLGMPVVVDSAHPLRGVG